MAQAKFRYEEQENSEEFFLPYIWEVIHQLGLIPWLEPAVEEEDQDGGENDSGTGTGTGSSNGNSTASDDCPQQQLVSPHSYNAHPDNSTSASITKNNSVNDHYELKSHSKYSNNMNRNSRSSSSSSSSSGEDDRTSLGSNRASYDARLQAYTTDQHHSTSTLTRSHPLSPSSSSASAAGLAPSAAPPATASSLPTTRPDSDDAITISIDADIVTAPKINTDDSNAKGECNDTSNGNTIQTSTDAPPSILSYPFEFITGHANNLINLL